MPLLVDQDGFRQIIRASEGSKEAKDSWLNFLRHLKECRLSGTQLFISDKGLGLFETLLEVFPEAKYQRCVVDYRNVFSVVPTCKAKEVAAMLKAVHAPEDMINTREKAKAA